MLSAITKQIKHFTPVRPPGLYRRGNSILKESIGFMKRGVGAEKVVSAFASRYIRFLI